MTPRLPPSVPHSLLVLVLPILLVASSCSGGDGAEDTSTSTSTSTSRPGSSEPAPDPTAPGTSSGPAALFESVCDATATIEDVGRLESPEITEASGLSGSWVNEEAWWVHNDSGDAARIFLVAGDGTQLATVALDGAEARDWESIAVGPGAAPDRAVVYVGDTGDNAVMRDPAGGRGSIRVYRFEEPEIDLSAAPTETSAQVDTLTFEFPGGAHDVEALLIDPLDGDLVVVTKDWQRTGAAQVFRGDADAAPGSTTPLEQVGQVPLEPGTLVTAADVTTDGALVALRSYGAVHLYLRPAGEPLWAAFETAPCEGPVPTELQGESLGFALDGASYLTVSEGEHAALHRTS